MMRILVVDDDSELRSMLQEFFQRRGFAVECEHEGTRGAARAVSEPFDLLILDVVLPGIDGFEVLRQVREQSQIPVLMLTARGESGERVQGLELGADDYLPKPFDPEELLARVRAILRRTAATSDPAEALEIGELRLFPGSRDATFRGQWMGLTAMECEILEQLIRNCGRVVSRDHLTLQLYQRQATHFDRSLDTHVSRIRKKLGDGRGMILSVRGTGYQLRFPASTEAP
jgi:two-component system response regulator CpxR